jgi:hypothetical protein
MSNAFIIFVESLISDFVFCSSVFVRIHQQTLSIPWFVNSDYLFIMFIMSASNQKDWTFLKCISSPNCFYKWWEWLAFFPVDFGSFLPQLFFVKTMKIFSFKRLTCEKVVLLYQKKIFYMFQYYSKINHV